jgi:type II secretory pathway component PulF
LITTQTETIDKLQQQIKELTDIQSKTTTTTTTTINKKSTSEEWLALVFTVGVLLMEAYTIYECRGLPRSQYPSKEKETWKQKIIRILLRRRGPIIFHDDWG